MALTIENENYAQAYNGHLENKTTIKSIVFGDIYPTEFMENNCYVWEGEIMTTTKPNTFGYNFCCR